MHEENTLSVKQAYLWYMFKNTSKSVRTLTIVVLPDLLSPTPSTSLTLKTPENTEEDPDNPELADGDIQMECSSD